MGTVPIYQFQFYDIGTDEYRTSNRWGTREGISGVGGKILEKTRTMVNSSEVGSEINGLTSKGFSPPPVKAVTLQTHVER